MPRASEVAPETPRFFFVHLQKTGGTALYQRLRHAFGPQAVYPTPEDQGDPTAVLAVDHLVERWWCSAPHLRAVTGHFPLCAATRLGLRFITFTVLRDPVERTLSVLRRRRVADDRYRGWELERIYADPALTHVITNHMVKMLSMTSDEMGPVPLMEPVVFDDRRLQRAMDNVEHHVDLFGLQSHFEEFCTELGDRYGLDLGAPRFANRTAPVPVTEELRERVAADNRMDIELYEFAARLWHRRHRAAVGPELETQRG